MRARHLAALLLWSLVLQGQAVAQETAMSDFWIASANREAMYVLDVNASREGISGAAATLYQFNAEANERGDIVAASFEFDCLDRRMRVVGDIRADRHFQRVSTDDQIGSWGSVPRGSQMESYMDVACFGRSRIPRTWHDAPDNLRDLAEVYYRAFLGQSY